MSIKILKNISVPGNHGKPILADTFFNDDSTAKSIVIFCHGYKGFKDWGAWDIMAKTFANANLFFIKFNFSHNGGTAEQPMDFPDLEAFGNNNYTKELDDLKTVINWVLSNQDYKQNINKKSINIIGHSRGGGIVTITAEEDARISKVVSLAGVSDYGKRTTIGNLEAWKKDGVKYVMNGRTKQQMPHFYQFYENFIENEERLTIKRAVTNLKIPYLIIHGNKDNSVLIDEAHQLKQWNSDSQLEIIDGADHVFNTQHPWNSNETSVALDTAIKSIISFIKA